MVQEDSEDEEDEDAEDEEDDAEDEIDSEDNMDPNKEMKDRILSIIDQNLSTYSKCEFAFALNKSNETYKICFGVIRFWHGNDKSSEEKTYRYGNFVMVRKVMTANDAREAIKGFLTEEKITFFDFGEIKVPPLSLESSGRICAYQRHGLAFNRLEWPSVKFFYNLSRQDTGSFPGTLLSNINYPLYPSYQYAMSDFMNTEENPVGVSRIEIILPEFDARIKKVKRGENKIKVEIESRLSKETDLLVKTYIQNADGSHTISEKPVENNEATFMHERGPLLIQLGLFSKKSGKELDTKAIYPYWLEPWQELDPEEYGLMIQRIIQEGENYKVEFKQKLSNQTGEFLETVSSFANTNGGLILLGVTDNAEIVGFRVNKDVITNTIASNCEPFPKFDITEVKMGVVPLTIVEIKEGDNKPYSIKDRGIYIRKNATDRQITRTELDELSKKKAQAYGNFTL